MASRAIRNTTVLMPGASSVAARWRERSDRRGVAGACALLAAATALAIPAYNQMLPLYEYVLGAPLAPLYAFLGAAPAVVLTGAGLLAWRSHPASRIGLLLILEGLFWNLGTLAFASSYLPAA